MPVFFLSQLIILCQLNNASLTECDSSIELHKESISSIILYYKWNVLVDDHTDTFKFRNQILECAGLNTLCIKNIKNEKRSRNGTGRKSIETRYRNVT